MKFYFSKNPLKTISFFLVAIPLFFLKGNFLNAEYLSEEFEMDTSTNSEEDSSVIPTNTFEMDTSTKFEEDSSVIPTNPFEIVEMIRRHNSLNDATNPSDAVNDALESFENYEDK